jgi:hypothetical protein
MAAIPVARLLFELGVPQPPAATGLAEDQVAQRCGRCRSEAEMSAQIEAAHARGAAEGWERGRSERIQSEKLRLAKLKDEQDADLTALARQALGRIDAGLAATHADVSQAVARALVSFFQGKIELEATTAISDELRHILTEHGAARVSIRGPQPWIDRLALLPEVVSGVAKVEVQANDAVDVTINIDGTVLETTVGDWLSGLGRAL